MNFACIRTPHRAAVSRCWHGLTRLTSDSSAWPGRAIAAFLLLAAAPFLLVAVLLGADLRVQTRVGRWGNLIKLYVLSVRGKSCELPGILWAIAAGEMSWVGPEARPVGVLDRRLEVDRKVNSVLPGLICDWWVRKRTNIHYGTQSATDCEYVEKGTLRSDVGLLARAAVAWFYGGGPKQCRPVAKVLGLLIDNLTLEEAVDAILAPPSESGARQVSFINVDCANKSVGDAEYAEILRTSDLRLGDGIGLRIGGRLVGSEIRQNVNGTDLFPVLCSRMAECDLRLFLLGGRPGVPEDVAKWIESQHPRLQVVGTQHGYFERSRSMDVCARINASGADVVLVAFGAPLQEAWIRRHRTQLGARAALGVGGLFDFYSGRVPRAPQWLREMGMEWCYRLCQEPKRMWRRYLIGNLVFLVRILISRYTHKDPYKQVKEAHLSQ